MEQFRVKQLSPWLGEKYLGVADVIRIPSRRFKGGYEYVSLCNVLEIEAVGNKLCMLIRYGSPARQKYVKFNLGSRASECYDLIMAKFEEERREREAASGSSVCRTNTK